MATAKKIPAKKTTKASDAEEKAPKKTVKKAGTAAPAAVKKAAPKAKKIEAVEVPAGKLGKKLAAKKELPSEAPLPAAPKPPAQRPKPTMGLTPHAQAILSAIQEGRAVEFLFADSETNAPRTFEPRQLIYDTLSQAWFAWGWDRRYNAERHHCLDLLAEVNAVEGVGRSAQGPYKEGTPGNQIGGWLGGEPIPVKALLHKQWVFAVKQAPPAFPEYRLEDAEDGKAQVSFTATDLRAIARWVLQFGDGITIQEPARLLDRVRQVAAVWLGKDAKSHSAPRTGDAEKAAPSASHEHAPRTTPAPRHESRHSESRHSESKHSESKHSEPRHSEAKTPEASQEGRPERHREQHHREREAREETKSSNPKVEIRTDRL